MISACLSESGFEPCIALLFAMEASSILCDPTTSQNHGTPNQFLCNPPFPD